ncbi:MAG: metallophosphoesterase [Candidatus Zixiibacteriota bacterium]
MRIVHIGDEHLGGAYPEKAAKSFEFLTTQLWEDQTSPAFDPDLIVSTGDLTDRPLHVHSEHLKPFLNFVKTANCPIVLLQGTPSHEPLGAIDNIAAVSDGKIITITSPFDLHVFPESGGAVMGLPALTRPQLAKWAKQIDPSLNGFEDPDAAVKLILSSIGERWKNIEGPRILTYHGVLRGCTTATGQVLAGGTLEVAREDLALANPDVVLCADIHLAQEWVTPCPVSYCGSSHPCNWGERDQKSFTVIDLNENGAIENFERIPFPHKPMVKIDLEFTGEQFDGQWFYIENGGRHFKVSDMLAVCIEGNEIKVSYTIPREIAAAVDDAYIRVLFGQRGIDLASVERIIKTEYRERIVGIAAMQTTAQQYEAVCMARSVDARIGAIAKADLIDEQGVTL